MSSFTGISNPAATSSTERGWLDYKKQRHKLSTCTIIHMGWCYQSEQRAMIRYFVIYHFSVQSESSGTGAWRGRFPRALGTGARAPSSERFHVNFNFTPTATGYQGSIAGDGNVHGLPAGSDFTSIAPRGIKVNVGFITGRVTGNTGNCNTIAIAQYKSVTI